MTWSIPSPYQTRKVHRFSMLHEVLQEEAGVDQNDVTRVRDSPGLLYGFLPSVHVPRGGGGESRGEPFQVVPGVMTW